MKKGFLAVFFIIAIISLKAQQRPHYTQYILNNYLVNPAIAGIENYVDLKIGARQQWVGIDGAPSNFYLTVHGPLGKKDEKQNPSSFSMRGENPRGKSYWEEYTAATPHHGVGLNINNYKTGYISRTYATANYAYHLGISGQTSLAAGFGLGVSGTTIDRSKIQLANPLDPVVSTGSGEWSKISPELNAGLWLYSASYFAGLSAQQIIPTKFLLLDSSKNQSTAVPHLFFTAGYRSFLNDDFSILPSILFRYIASMPVYKDINLKIQYQDKVWVGGSFRFQQGFAGMFGVNISQKLNLSYSYDMNNTPYLLSAMQRGTHEIVLGFLLNNSYGDWCPRNIW